MNIHFLGIVMILVSCGAVSAFAGSENTEMASRISAQLAVPGRDRFDQAKDPGRKPVEVAQFFGVEAGMTILDMITGAGYNAEILAAAVGPNGTVYAQNSHYVVRLINGAHHQAMLGRLADERLPNVRYIVVDTEDMPFEASVDMAFWGMNMHDIYNADGEVAVIEFLQHVKRALKPGAILAVSDHVGVAGRDNAELHRIEPKILQEMLVKAGFTIEASSDLLANPDDDHSQSVYADGLRYATDRILVKARKPK